jgi:pilus assembly protein CpaE
MTQSQSASIINIVIADADPDDLARTRALLLQDRNIQVVATATERNQVLPLLELEPEIFLLSSNIDPRDTTTLIKQLLELSPSTQVLLVTDSNDTSEMRRAVVAGARGILHKPIGPDELIGTIREVIEAEQGRRVRLDEIERQRKEKATRGRVILVFSPKGGVGCTLVACNIAIALARSTKKRVALVDYSLQFGTIATLLNLQSIHNLSELVPHPEDIDSTILQDVMVQHASGVRVLLPPSTLEQVESITTESLVHILEGLRSHFDYVVVDTWHAVEDATLAMMELADNLLLVTTPEVPALSTARRFLDMLKNYPQLRHKPQLVVNRHPSKGGVDLREIEQSIGLQPVATIPSDGAVMTLAINEGVPVLQRNISSVTVRNLSALADTLAVRGDLVPTPSTNGAGRLFGLSRRGRH